MLSAPFPLSGSFRSFLLGSESLLLSVDIKTSADVRVLLSKAVGYQWEDNDGFALVQAPDNVLFGEDTPNPYWFSSADMHYVLTKLNMSGQCHLVQCIDPANFVHENLDPAFTTGEHLVIFQHALHYALLVPPKLRPAAGVCGIRGGLQDVPDTKCGRVAAGLVPRALIPRIKSRGCCGPDAVRLAFQILAEHHAGGFTVLLTKNAHLSDYRACTTWSIGYLDDILNYNEHSTTCP